MKPRRKRPAQKGGSDESPDQGESLKAKELWKAACDRVKELYDLAQERPDLLRPIARQQIAWPGFISHKAAFDTDNAELMDKIELGVGTFSTKKWQLSATSTQFAIGFYSLCRDYEKQFHLPPLTKKNKRSRFEQVWRYAVNELGVVPENNPYLAKLGKSATRTRSGWDVNYRGRACDVRAEIKRQVWNAFNVLIG